MSYQERFRFDLKGQKSPYWQGHPTSSHQGGLEENPGAVLVDGPSPNIVYQKPASGNSFTPFDGLQPPSTIDISNKVPQHRPSTVGRANSHFPGPAPAVKLAPEDGVEAVLLGLQNVRNELETTKLPKDRLSGPLLQRGNLNNTSNSQYQHPSVVGERQQRFLEQTTSKSTNKRLSPAANDSVANKIPADNLKSSYSEKVVDNTTAHDDDQLSYKGHSNPKSTSISGDEAAHFMINQERMIHLFAEFLQQRKDSIPIPEDTSFLEPANNVEKAQAETEKESDDEEPPYKRVCVASPKVSDSNHLGFEMEHERPLSNQQSGDEHTNSLSHGKGDTCSEQNAANSCKTCQESPHTATLLKTIELLRKENKHLNSLSRFRLPSPPPPPRVGVFYRVKCECGSMGRLAPRTTVYLDPPRRNMGSSSWHLQGNLHAPDQTLFLDQNNDVVLLVYKEYRCAADALRYGWQRQAQAEIEAAMKDAPSPTPLREGFLINSQFLLEGLSVFTGDLESSDRTQDFSYRKEVKAPFHYLYYNRARLLGRTNNMDEEHRKQASLLVDYIQTSFQASLLEANNLFFKGSVRQDTIPYLFEPNMKVVSSESGNLLAFMTTDYIAEDVDTPTHDTIWKLKCWSWVYDGNFLRKRFKVFKVTWQSSIRDGATRPLHELAVYPLKYASDSLLPELMSRGKMFWHCRTRIYVSCKDATMTVDPIHVCIMSQRFFNLPGAVTNF